MSTGQSTTAHSSTDDAADLYRGNPAELYETYFVPAIGVPFATRLVDTARLRRGQRVVDIACGTGVAARMAARRVGASGSVTGIDGHPEMLGVAEKSTPADTTIDWQLASADGLPLPDNSFDVALCSLGMQFFADRVAALAEMKRVLAPGGLVAIDVAGPTPPVFEVLHDVLADHLGVDVAGFVHAVFALDEPDHLRDLAARAGFGDIDVTSSSLTLSLDAPAHFLWQYLQSTPLAVATAGLDDERRALLQDEITRRWAPFVIDGRVTTDVGCIIATAT